MNFAAMSPLTTALVVANVVIYLLLSTFHGAPAALALWPVATGAFEPWQVVTYAFLHGSFTRLLKETQTLLPMLTDMMDQGEAASQLGQTQCVVVARPLGCLQCIAGLAQGGGGEGGGQARRGAGPAGADRIERAIVAGRRVAAAGARAAPRSPAPARAGRPSMAE